MLVYGLYEEGYGVQFAGWKIFPHHKDHFISGLKGLKVLQRRVLKSCRTDVQNVYFFLLASAEDFLAKGYDMQLQTRNLITKAFFLFTHF
jgi:hypothetical protein